MKKAVNILVVEDNPGDQRLISEALAASGGRNKVFMVSDGISALEFVRQEGKFRGSPHPQLILLDQSLPKKSGRDVLQGLKSDPVLRRIPVIIFSSSNAEADISEAYGLHANAYVVKPGELDQFFSTIRTIEAYWTTIAELPR